MHGSRERQSGSTRTGRNRKFRFRNDTTSCYHASKLVDMRPVPWQTTIVRYRKRLCFRSVVEKSCKENDLQRQSLTSPPKRRRTTPHLATPFTQIVRLTSPPKRRRTTPMLEGSLENLLAPAAKGCRIRERKDRKAVLAITVHRSRPPARMVAPPPQPSGRQQEPASERAGRFDGHSGTSIIVAS